MTENSRVGPKPPNKQNYSLIKFILDKRISLYTCTCSSFVCCLCKQTVLFFLDIDDCQPDPCQNNGTCYDLVIDYRCDCMAGFNGTNCENSMKILQ